MYFIDRIFHKKNLYDDGLIQSPAKHEFGGFFFIVQCINASRKQETFCIVFTVDEMNEYVHRKQSVHD